MMPIIQYGISLPTMKVILGTGVTLICSMVPASFSPTMFIAGRNPVIKATTSITRAGIMGIL